MVVALLALAEEIGGLQRRIAAPFQVVFDVVVHRGAEDQRGVVTAVGVERRQCAEGADIGTVEIEDRLRVALGVVGGDEHHAVFEEYRAVEVAVAVPAGVAQHDEARSRAPAARDARIGRGDSREDALDLDLIVGHDDENIVLAVIQQRRQVARIVGGTVRRVHISIGILPVVGIAQQGEDLGFEVLVRAVAVNQRHLFVPVHQVGDLVPFVRRVGCHLEQGVAVHPRDAGQRRDDGDVVLLGIEDDGMEPLLVYGADDQPGAGEGVAFDEFADRIHIAGRVVKREVYRVAVFRPHAVQPQQEALVEFEVVAVGLVADGHRQHQCHLERCAAAQGAEFDLLRPAAGKDPRE